MAPELDVPGVLAEADRILRDGSKGFAWAPWIDRRYGFLNGVIKPMLTVCLRPPVVENAPFQGRKDWKALERHRRSSTT